MPRALHKVQKQISKKRGGKPTALHENSRDARRLRQAGAREDKLAKTMNVAARSNQIYIDRVAWFQEAVVGRETLLTDAELQTLVQDFVDRDEEELAELKAAQRPGRPTSKSQERIQGRIDSEDKEFKAGFWTPDVRDADSLAKLKLWGGSWAGLNTLKFVRVHKAGNIKESSFPPKGLS